MISDAELVARALLGSQEAYRELVVRFERPIFGLVLRMVHDPGVAEELAQETFVKAFRHLDRFRPEQKLSSWLFKIAHNTTLDHLRRHAPETLSIAGQEDEAGGLLAVLADASAPSPEEEAERRQLARALERAIAALRPTYREAVLLFYMEGVSYQELSEIMGLPLGTVKTHLHRARKELAEAMASAGWGRAATLLPELETGPAPRS